MASPLTRLLPYNRFGDRIAHWFHFLRRHKRLPRRRKLFSDELYRIKTSDEILDPLRVFVSDKEYVKLFVKAVCGDEYNVPTSAVLTSVDEIRAYDFPATCCIKPTHASRQVILRRDGAALDLERIERWLEMNFYYVNREANYRRLRPKVIVEPIIYPHLDDVLDYKCFCYGGELKLVQVDTDRHTARKQMVYDRDWKLMDFSISFRSGEGGALPMPANFATMREVAEKLSARFGLVRVDLYSDGETCMVGEITNCAGNAGARFFPRSGERRASEIIFGEAP